jgi:predicted amidophosphoribosyltransferase
MLRQEELKFESKKGRAQWFKPAILATLKAKIGMIVVPSHPGQKFSRTLPPSQPMAGRACHPSYLREHAQ